MSYQAMGAVLRYSRYRESKPENFIPFKVMQAFAWHADPNGMVGVAGDWKKCIGQRTITEWAAVSRANISNHIKAIIQSGELSIVAQGGDGRANWTVYQINLEMEATADSCPQVSTPNQTQRLLQEVLQITQRTSHLSSHRTSHLSSHRTSHLSSHRKRTYQLKGLNVSPLRSKVEPDPDPYIIDSNNNNISSSCSKGITTTTDENELRSFQGEWINKDGRIVTHQPEEPDPLEELVAYFTELTGCKMRNNLTEDERVAKWFQPLIDMYHHTADNFQETKNRLKTAVETLKSKRNTNGKAYIIVAPQSVYNAFINLPSPQQQTVQGTERPLPDFVVNQPPPEQQSADYAFRILRFAMQMHGPNTQPHGFHNPRIAQAVERIGWKKLFDLDIAPAERLFINVYEGLPVRQEQGKVMPQIASLAASKTVRR